MINSSSNKIRINKYLVILIVIIFYLSFRIFLEYRENTLLITQPKTIIDKPENLESYIYSVNNFEIIYTKINQYKFEAIPNFKNQYTSQDIIDIKKCNILFNGGFYMKNSHPLGLYYYNQDKIGNFINSSTFNGIISLDKDSRWKILFASDYYFDKSSLYAIQTGPILVSKSKLIDSLNLNGLGRRIVFILDKYNNPSILVVYNKNVLNDGPNFDELIDIINILINDKGIDIYDAINLDGGNSSLYVDDYISLKESMFPGSYLCFYK